MKTKHKQLLQECAGCRDFRRCAIKWGRNCIRKAGKKIPRINLGGF